MGEFEQTIIDIIVSALQDEHGVSQDTFDEIRQLRDLTKSDRLGAICLAADATDGRFYLKDNDTDW